MTYQQTHDEQMAFLASFLPPEAMLSTDLLKVEINEVHRRLTMPPDQLLMEFPEIDRLLDSYFDKDPA